MGVRCRYYVVPKRLTQPRETAEVREAPLEPEAEARLPNRLTGMTEGERNIIESAGEWEAKSEAEDNEERSIRAFDNALDDWFGEDLAKVRRVVGFRVARMPLNGAHTSSTRAQACRIDEEYP